MNVNVNNVISQIPDNIIKGNYSNSMNKGMFANMLNDAMGEVQNLVPLLGNNTDNFLDISDIEGIVEEHNVEIEHNDETKANYCYENLNEFAETFFFRPEVVIEEALAENNVLNADYNVLNAQLPVNDIEQNISHALQKEQEASLPFQTNMIEKLISDHAVKSQPRLSGDIEGSIEAQNIKPSIEAQIMKPAIVLSEKQTKESAYAEILTPDKPLAENKIITITDGSTEIKSQVLSQVKDKIIIMTENAHEPNGIKTITMELRPQALGKVNIKMSYENNKLTVEIKALNEETQKILSSNTNELMELLSKTSEADVKIIVEPYEMKNQNVLNYQNSEQSNVLNFYQNNEQNHQGRQRNKYYYDNNIKTREEDLFSELIDLNYSKSKEGIHGN